MPLNEFTDMASAPRRHDNLRVGLRGQARDALLALLGDVAYFWWAFAGLGAVMALAALC